ncbi:MULTISPECIES: large conductance mechanosensitive channel protein MscL [Eubacterium]|uniref:Large-conductance mechanosensitive channel n=2 Tax=Eubacterium TaxID=1730 RepID=A0A1T4MD61_9FIRM|nr:MULTISPECIES: large conductance mechanosensitive channel protein MscL [Eubacterium]MCR5369075.1 large conductance mechanosensitive channel protein MscL [Eubacterium sp.]SCW47142.1 large conductance mechanosensitive channel [Eubacterium ruminantium]SDM54313.1 large conductance mechanosensitive channel [Eubacterium ruminantium]SJZ64787.1 large conductance mechanosensitive channel [Eubacterium ruminantium]
MKKFLKEFKEFALKGNVMDLAIGMIIGGAFSSIVASLTDNIINPIVGCFVAGGLNGWTVTVGKAQLGIGAFIMAVVNFIILAFVLFLMLKGMNKMLSLRKKEEEAAAPAEPSAEEKLLTEIRDLLKDKQ